MCIRDSLISCVILTLLLSLWIKGRIYETGVLLSLGISKTGVVLQYICELMIIAVLAFGLSFLFGKAMSQSLGDRMMAQIQKQQENSQAANSISITGNSMRGGLQKLSLIHIDVYKRQHTDIPNPAGG